MTIAKANERPLNTAWSATLHRRPLRRGCWARGSGLATRAPPPALRHDPAMSAVHPHRPPEALARELATRARVRNGPQLRRLPRYGGTLAARHPARVLSAAVARTFPARARLFWGDRMAVRLPELLSCQLY